MNGSRRKFKPTRRGDLVTRLVNNEEVWYFDDYIKEDRFDTPRRVRKSTGCVKADYEHAKEVRDKIRASLKAGDGAMRRPLTFAEWVPLFRATYEREPRNGKDISEGTIGSHDSMLPTLIDYFGKMRLDRISDADCLGFRGKRLGDTRLDAKRRPLADGSTVSASTVLKECQFAASIMADAVRAGKMAKNPWTCLQLGRIASRVRTLSMDELQNIYQWCREHNREAGRFISLSIGFGGLRIGAMLALPLRPVKEGDNAIEVWSKGQLVRQPVMHTAQRLIDEQAAYIIGYRPNADRLFPYARGTVEAWIRDICNAVGIARFTPHDIRRTFGTEATQQIGLELSAFLMNNTPAVAARHYNKPAQRVVDDKKLRALETATSALPTLDSPSVTTAIASLQVAQR